MDRTEAKYVAKNITSLYTQKKETETEAIPLNRLKRVVVAMRPLILVVLVEQELHSN